MPFDWREYLVLARFLQAQAGGSIPAEAGLRAAVGKAYSAAFCHVRNHARDHLGFQPRYGPDDHGRLRAFLRHGKTFGISVKLEDLRLWRNECDYADEPPADLALLAAEAIRHAEEIFRALTPPPPATTGP
jgi:hypothetical protein